MFSNAGAGAEFVFGASYEDHFYVFKVRYSLRRNDGITEFFIEGYFDYYFSWISDQCPLLYWCYAIHHRKNCMVNAEMFGYNSS